jgi:hypothetical protein
MLSVVLQIGKAKYLSATLRRQVYLYTSLLGVVFFTGFLAVIYRKAQGACMCL